MTTKTIIIVRKRKTGALSYITGAAGKTSDDIAEAAQYLSAANAQPTIDWLLKQDFEKRNGCDLSLGEIEFVLRAETAIARKPVLSGWVIRRLDGKYYAGPKTRNANTWHEAHYKYVANRDSATAFPSREVAEERARGIQALLDTTAAEEHTSQEAYIRIAATFKPTFEKR